MNSALVIVSFLVLFSVCEYIYRVGYCSRLVARKVVHIVSGGLTIGATYIISFEQITLIAIGFAVVLLYVHNKPTLSSITTSDHGSFGSFLMPLGIAVCAMIFPTPGVFIPAIAVLTVADGMAGFFTMGIKHSLLFFALTLFVLQAFFSNQDITRGAQLLVIAAVVTIIEALSPKGSDNVTVPLVAALLVSSILV